MKRSAMLCLALCLAFQVSSASAATMYNLTSLGAFGASPSSGNATSSYAYAVNDLGHVAGKANASGQSTKAFFWKDNFMTGLGTLASGGGSSYAYGINDTDVVVGYSDYSAPYPAASGPMAFRWVGGTMTGLGWLDGGLCDRSIAYGVNKTGVITGISQVYTGNLCGDTNVHSYAFLYTNAMSYLPNLDHGTTISSFPQAINEDGDIAGWNSSAVTAAQNGSFVVPIGGSPIWLGDLGTPSGGGHISYAYGINDAMEVVGASSSPRTIDYEAYLWSEAGGMQALGDLPGGRYYSIAYGINNSRQVVGTGWVGPTTNPSDQEAFIWDSVNGMVSLNSLLLAAPGWRLIEARDINNNGQIVGWGINPSGGTEAVLLTPAPLDSPSIAFSPGSFVFSVKAGGTGTQSLVITNAGNGSMAWTTTRDRNWMSILPPSGMVAGGAYSYADVTVNSAGMAEGTYDGTISITAPGATNTPQVVPVSMTIPPQIVIAYPNGGETLRYGQNVTITWNVNTLQAVAKTDTSYSLDGGKTWKLIKSQRVLASSCPWRVPSLKAANNNCLVKVEFKNAAGAVIGQDRSNAAFTITK